MRYVNLMSFCQMTGLTEVEVRDLEARGLIRGTTKGGHRFYSYREAYRTKGIIYFMRTDGLNAEEAATKIDEQATAANQKQS